MRVHSYLTLRGGGFQTASGFVVKHAAVQLPTAVRVAMLLGCPLLSILAQESSSLVPNTWSDSPYMFGDRGGERTKLADVGVVLNVIYVNDLLADTQGALANWSRVRGTLDVDFGKAEPRRRAPPDA